MKVIFYIVLYLIGELIMMINKEDIIKVLMNLNLPTNGYWILAGSALVMHGVKRQTRDIDIGCTTELFEQLMMEGYKIKMNLDGTRSLNINELIEVFENWNVEVIEIINKLPVGSLLSIKKHKLRLGREKDIKDITLIDKHISNLSKNK